MYEVGDRIRIRPEATVLTSFPKLADEIGVVTTKGGMFDIWADFETQTTLGLDEHEVEPA